MNLQFVQAVAAGGAIGSVARYLVAIGSGKLFGTNFPWGILIINVTGSFLIGLLVGLFAVNGICASSPHFPDGRHLRRVHHPFDVLAGRLLPDGARRLAVFPGLHAGLGRFIDRGPGARAPAHAKLLDAAVDACAVYCRLQARLAKAGLCTQTAVNNPKIQLSATTRDMINFAVPGWRLPGRRRLATRIVCECDFSRMATR